uniref:Putative ovule protein n=1 Tax=Solanum chacoense TaxID=4108 RepID=A0A0V0HRQ0_SOLCH
MDDSHVAQIYVNVITVYFYVARTTLKCCHTPCQVLQKCTTFEGFVMHPSTFLRSTSNILYFQLFDQCNIICIHIAYRRM